MTLAQAHHRWANSATWAHAHPLRTTLESHAQAHPSRAKFSKWLAITVSGDAAHSDQQLGLDAVAHHSSCRAIICPLRTAAARTRRGRTPPSLCRTSAAHADQQICRGDDPTDESAQKLQATHQITRVMAPACFNATDANLPTGGGPARRTPSVSKQCPETLPKLRQAPARPSNPCSRSQQHTPFA